MDTSCPYCGGELAKQPKANCKCPQCGKIIYVRNKQPFFKKSLLTKEEMLISDEFVMLSSTYGFNVTMDTYLETKKMLNARFGTEAGWSDVAWSIYAQLNDRFARIPDFSSLEVTYACMAQHLYNRNKPYTWLIAESCKYQLRQCRQLGFKKVWVSVSSHSCQACDELTKKTFTITDELINNPPLPPEGCTCTLYKELEPGYCVCHLVATWQQ